jgi:hypothetical protein
MTTREVVRDALIGLAIAVGCVLMAVAVLAVAWRRP